MVDGWFDGRGFLREGEGFELTGERADPHGQGCGLDAFELRVHLDDGVLSHVLASDCALVRGGRCVVSLRHFRTVALLEHKLLLGQEVVREYPVELPDLVQDGQLCRVS